MNAHAALTAILMLAFALGPTRQASGQTISTIAGGGGGDGGAATAASLRDAISVAVDGSGNIFVSDSLSHKIRKVDAATGLITTVAGNGLDIFSGDGGPATSASLRTPIGIAVDAAGHLYIADYSNLRVRKVDAISGIITTVAGNGLSTYSGDNGPATGAGVFPWAVALDAAGNLYIAERNNGRVRRVSAATGIITTVAGNGTFGFGGDGGLATSASLNGPNAAVPDANGNLYIADDGNNRVRRVAQATGIITTFAGNGAAGFSGDGGAATGASLNSPTALAFDMAGNLHIADRANSRVRKVAAGTITTVAGTGSFEFSGDGGPATSASLSNPYGIALDASGNTLIADNGNRRIRRITAGTITTVAGNGTAGYSGDGGPASDASFEFPNGVAFDAAGNLYVADEFGHRVRKVLSGTTIMTTVAGNGTNGFSGDGGLATSASLNTPLGVVVDAAGNLYIADSVNGRIRKVAAATGTITTFAGGGSGGLGDGGPATSAVLVAPVGLAIDAASNIYIADRDGRRIRKVTAGTITTVAGGGIINNGDGGLATSAMLNSPRGVAVDAAGNLFIADRNDHRVRRVDAITQVITTFAGTGSNAFHGDGGPAASAAVNSPVGVALDAAGDLFIAVQGSHRIRKVSAGIITTVAGNGGTGDFSGDGGPATSASLDGPSGVAIDPGGHLHIADHGNQRIRKVRNPSGQALYVGNCSGCHSFPPTGTKLNAAGSTSTVLDYVRGYQPDMAQDHHITFDPVELGLIAGYIAEQVPPILAVTPPGVAKIIDVSSHITLNTVSFTHVEIVTPPVHGSISAFAATAANYAPNAGFVGVDSFTYRGKRTSPEALAGDPRTVTVLVTNGVPAIALDASSLDFGEQLLDTTSPPRTVSARNTGTAPLSLIGKLGGPDSFEFSLVAACGPALSPLARCAYTTQFSPLFFAGPRSATLTISSNDPANPTKVVALSGIGAGSDSAPDPFSFAPQSGVMPGSTVTSAATTITGIDTVATVTVANGSYSIGCTATFVDTAGSIGNGQTVCVRHVAAGPGGSVTTTLTVGGVSADFVSTTLDFVPADLNADSTSDLLLRHTDGSVYLWIMDTYPVSGAFLATDTNGWVVTHVADFDGDGKADIVMKHTNGSVKVLKMNGTLVVSGALLLGAGTPFTVTHAGDVNGDAKADLILRHTDGSVYIWTMNGVPTGGGFLGTDTNGWVVTHVADFNGDGKADIVMKHTDGSVKSLQMNGAAITAGYLLLGTGTPWTVTHAGDVNGDDRSDLVLRHTDGSVYIWTMNGAPTGGNFLGTDTNGWVVTHMADFNGDGRADIVMKHTNGSVKSLLMNGTTITNGYLLLGAGTPWTVTHTLDTTGDGKADILLRHTDQSVYLWVVDGFPIGGAYLLLGANPWTLVPPMP